MIKNCNEVAELMAILRRSRSLSLAERHFPNGRDRHAVRCLFLRHRLCCGTVSLKSYLGQDLADDSPASRIHLDSSESSIELRPLAKTAPAPAQGLALLIPDVHVPYHDDRAWSLMLSVAEAIRPEHVIVLGDFADCYAVSFHDKSASRTSRLADELRIVAECLRELERRTPDARTRVYIEGNHEARLSRYIARQAGALHGLPGMTLGEILELRDHGWQWVPYHQSWTFGDLHLTHDVGRAGISSARQSRIAYGASIGIGHVHRMTIEHERTVDGRHHVGASFGWLGDAEAVDYRHRGLARREWVHGVGLAQADDQGRVHVQAVPFIAGRAWVAGRMISA